MTPLFSRRRGRAQVPAEARDAITTAPGERLLSFAVRTEGGWLVASNHQLYAVEPTGEVGQARPWHLVDAGSWDADTQTLTVTWVGPTPDNHWQLEVGSLLPETLRERVQASVVIAERVPLPGKAISRAVIRQDLATSELVPQVVLGRGVRAADPGVQESARATLNYLKEQVGLT